MKTLLTNILPALIIALGLCGAAWIYGTATRYGELRFSPSLDTPMAIDHRTGRIYRDRPSDRIQP
jgi:hypothetical protein